MARAASLPGAVAALLLLAAGARAGTPAPTTAYSGCLLFIDDASKDQLGLVERFKPRALPRSWYRWGEPHPDKAYAARRAVLETLARSSVTVGGGGSLSVVNDRDLADPSFDPAWLSVGLDGNPAGDPSRRRGTLSSPGFRGYLVAKAVEQARLGLAELHFGETHGELAYDDWTLGLRGDSGFVQWLRGRWTGRTVERWREELGTLGEAIALGRPVDRALFAALDGPRKARFAELWGREGSWQGDDAAGRPAFLAWKYRENLQAFLAELRAALAKEDLPRVAVDVWGFADWMKDLSPAPDAFLASPPDERWGLKWNTDPAFPLEPERGRLRALMAEQTRAAYPVPVVYLFDHPTPFLTSFRNLPDERQAALTAFFERLSAEVGASFMLRSYSEARESLGPKTRDTLGALCRRAEDYASAVERLRRFGSWCEGAAALAALGEPRALVPLASAFSTPSEGVSKSCLLDAMKRLGPGEGARGLLDAGRPPEREAGLRLMGLFPADAHLEALERALGDPDAAVRRAARRALGLQLRTPAWKSLVRRLLGSAAPEARAELEKALGGPLKL